QFSGSVITDSPERYRQDHFASASSKSGKWAVVADSLDPLRLEGMSKSDGALNNYLPEVERVPLLTPDEEIELGRRIRNGDAAAGKRMIHSNLRLVVTIARDDVDFGLPVLDLISEGNIGLMEAVGRFDPGRARNLERKQVGGSNRQLRAL